MKQELFSVEMKELIIQNANLRLASLEQDISLFSPKFKEEEKFFKEAEEKFLEVKSKYEKMLSERITQEEIIRRIVKEEKVENIEVKAVNTKVKEDKISWVGEAVKVLTQVNNFMLPEEIIAIILKDVDVEAKMKKLATGANKAMIKNQAIKSWQSHAAKVASGKYGKTLKPSLVIYKGKLGLFKWANTGEDNKIFPKSDYLKQFAFNGRKVQQY